MTIVIKPGSIIACVLAVLLVQAFADASDRWVDDSDKDGRNRSGLAVHTDYKTGLQYLCAPGGGITPRMDAHGQHMHAAKSE